MHWNGAAPRPLLVGGLRSLGLGSQRRRRSSRAYASSWRARRGTGLRREPGHLTTQPIERSHVPVKDRVRPPRGPRSIATGQQRTEGMTVAQAIPRGDVVVGRGGRPRRRPAGASGHARWWPRFSGWRASCVWRAEWKQRPLHHLSLPCTPLAWGNFIVSLTQPYLTHGARAPRNNNVFHAVDARPSTFGSEGRASSRITPCWLPRVSVKVQEKSDELRHRRRCPDATPVLCHGGAMLITDDGGAGTRRSRRRSSPASCWTVARTAGPRSSASRRAGYVRRQ